MNKQPKERFTSVADDYARYRPTYPAELLDWILSRAGLKTGPGAGTEDRFAAAPRLVDLGCGTGISARLFAARGFAVTGVDPNEAMLEKARAAAGGVAYARGESGRTGLPSASFDLATAAQAFHWFDLKATQAELRRVLKPQARCAAFWNVRASTPLLDAYETLLRRFSSEYEGLPRPDGTLKALKALPGVSRVEEARFRHVQRLDLDGTLGRARSSSYVALGVADKAGFERELRALFVSHAKDGAVDWAYDGVVLLFQP